MCFCCFVFYVSFLCVCRSMQKLTQLERLDLGSNEFTEVVSIFQSVCHCSGLSPHPSLICSLSYFGFFKHVCWNFSFPYTLNRHLYMIMWFIFLSLLTTTCFLFSTCAAWGGGVADWTQGAVDGREQTDLFTWGIIYAHIPVQWLLRLNTSSWDYFPRFSPNPPKLCVSSSLHQNELQSVYIRLWAL